jgi:predicted phosphoribosyltransferase
MWAFPDRHEAGKALAGRLGAYKGKADAVVLALPRGGVPVGYEVAKALDLPLDILLIRKLGLPGQEELAMGIPRQTIDKVVEKEQAELERRVALYRQGRPLASLRNKTVILVDDGVATGAGMHAALRAVRQHDPRRVIVAVPTAPADVHGYFVGLADAVVSLHTLDRGGVSAAYRDFRQTSDEEVIQLLDEAEAWRCKFEDSRPEALCGS